MTTEGVKRVAEAMMAAQPSEKAKRELYEQVGRAVVGLSNLEMLLAMLFAIITPRETSDVADFFYDQNGLEKRIRLIDFMAKGELTEAEMKTWQKVRQGILEHKGVRNLVAHQRMYIEQAGNGVQVTLRPPWLKKGGKDLDTPAIKKTADALEELKDDLWAFIGTLHRK